jgi:hypothetical protein
VSWTQFGRADGRDVPRDHRWRPRPRPPRYLPGL